MLVKEELSEWYCQVCGRKQVKELPAYLIPIDDDNYEFFRSCAICKRRAVEGNVTTYQQLIVIIRRRR